MSTMSTVILSAGTSAVVTAVVGTVLDWGRKVTAFITRHLRPDHAPLFLGANFMATMNGWNDSSLRIRIACAPSQTPRHVELNPDLAVRFVAQSFPGVFDDAPLRSYPDREITFRERGSDRGGLTISSSGRVDFDTSLSTQATDVAGPSVPVLEALDLILQVVAAMTSPGYRALTRRSRVHTGLDWYVGIAPIVTHPEFGTVPWVGMDLPGRQPAKTSETQRPQLPLEGYGAEDLRNWHSRRGALSVARAFLVDFFRMNGYYDSDGAVDDTIAHLHRTERLTVS